MAKGSTVEQKGLRPSIVLYCVRADLIGAVMFEEIGSLAGFPQLSVENLIADFRKNGSSMLWGFPDEKRLKGDETPYRIISLRLAVRFAPRVARSSPFRERRWRPSL